MSTAANANAAQTFVCALTGQSPVDDAVATPSGYICSRKLLLAKLSENGACYDICFYRGSAPHG